MLFELLIKDLILIEEVKIPFKSGLNILTGETGAGKSMVIGALNLILGAPGNKDLIRLGRESAYIKGSFFTYSEVNKLLSDMGFPVDEEVVSLSREILKKGKSIARINGEVATVAQLKTIANVMIDIHGQTDNLFLLDSDHQLSIIDQFAGGLCESLKAEVKSLFLEITDLEKRLSEWKEKSKDRAREVDFITFQLEEIEEANLKIDEDSLLEKEFDFLNQVEAISGHVEGATSWLTGDYTEGALSALSSLSSALEKYSEYDQHLGDFSTRLKDAFFILDDLNQDMSRYKERIEQNPQRLRDVEQRLDKINRLKSKYGQSLPDIINFSEDLNGKLEQLNSLEKIISDGENQLSELMSSYKDRAFSLSKIRRESAKKFESELLLQLSELNMKEATFHVDFINKMKPSANGIDEIEFMISTNLGMPSRPLKKVVSGGELSRLMLGIKIIMGESERLSTLVFDEIDTGISGVTANVVGEKMAKLALNEQIICITHLPQIAVYGDHNLLIEKIGKEDSTITSITTVTEDRLEKEIGRLVGGVKETEVTRNHANEMIQSANNKKNAMKL